MTAGGMDQFIVLLVLDGWGIFQHGAGNAIERAQTPVFDDMVKRYPVAVLQAAGESVGLPWGEIGNSEVGHFAIGTGRLVYHNLLKINKDIWSGDFFRNRALLTACEHTQKNSSALHLVGMVSTGGVHSYLDHLYALLDLAKKKRVQKVFLHAILDGRDTPYNSGRHFIAMLEERMKGLHVGVIASLHGRRFAMDRDRHWERTALSYNAMVKGESKHMFTSAVEAIDSFYAKDIYDEEIEPIVIQTREGAPVAKIADGDAVIFFNFRADRARQLTRALTAQQFSEFKRTRRVRNLLVVTFTEYDALFTVAVAWPKEIITHPLAEVLAQAGMKQLHIAETEKYAHVTYFFNGGTEKRYDGEDHVLIPSKRDARYDTIPEMSASDIASRIIREVASKHYQFIVANFANADMVGHTANLKATMAAVETVDREVGRIAEVVLAEKGTLIITADHGNAEMLVNIETGQLQKEHTTNPVPCVIVNENFEGRNLGFPDPPGGDLSLVTPVGLLSDIAPTILKLFGLKKPKEMTGRSLI